MPIREEPLPQDVLDAIPGASSEGASLVDVSRDQDPALIVSAVNTFVASPPKGSLFKRIDNWNDRAMPLGALWGEQLARRFGWLWMMVDEDGEKSIGLFDPRRSMGVLPFEYVFYCLESGECPTIELAYNMVQDGALPAFPDRAYTNIMDGIQHVVPPR